MTYRYHHDETTNKTNQVILVFLVLTLVSSFPAVAFVAGNNVNLAFAKKHDSTNSTNGGSSSSDNSGGQTTTGGSNNSSSSSSNNAPASPSSSPSTTQTTCPDGSSPDANGNCPAQTTTPSTTQNPSMPSLTQQTCPPLPLDANGNCPITTHPATSPTNTPPLQPKANQFNSLAGNLGDLLASPTPHNGGGIGLGLPPATIKLPTASFDSTLNACPFGFHRTSPGSTECLSNNPQCPSGYQIAGDECVIPAPPAPAPAAPPPPPMPTCPIHTVLDATGDCVSLAVAQDIQNGIVPIADGKLRLATVPPVPNTNTIATICPDISHLVGSKCVMNGQGCEPGYVQDEDICTPTTRSLPVYPGSTTGSGGGFIQMFPTCPGGSVGSANGTCPTPTSSPTTQTQNTGSNTAGGTTTQYVPAVDGKCPSGSQEAGGSSGNAGQPGTGSVICRLDNPPASTSTSTATPASTQSSNSGAGNGGGTTTNTGGTTNTTKTPMNTGTTGTGGGTPTTTTSAKTTTTTTTTPKQTGTTTSGSTGTPTSTAKATTTKIINNKNVVRGSSTSGGGGGGGTHAPTSPPFITYANTLNKITIRYPSTWTKTEFAGNNPSVPVLFNAPTTTASTGSRTTFMVIVNKLAPPITTLDNYTLQQLYGLTHSNTTKYTIINTNTTELTPPTGITAYHEISYNGMKNSVVNNVPVLVPLKGTAIFFVKGDTGYSLLYLAKQIDYPQQLPMIQQMINSFQAGNATTTSGAGVGSSSGTVTNSG